MQNSNLQALSNQLTDKLVPASYGLINHVEFYRDASEGWFGIAFDSETNQSTIPRENLARIAQQCNIGATQYALTHIPENKVNETTQALLNDPDRLFGLWIDDGLCAAFTVEGLKSCYINPILGPLDDTLKAHVFPAGQACRDIRNWPYKSAMSFFDVGNCFFDKGEHDWGLARLAPSSRRSHLRGACLFGHAFLISGDALRKHDLHPSKLLLNPDIQKIFYQDDTVFLEKGWQASSRLISAKCLNDTKKLFEKKASILFENGHFVNLMKNIVIDSLVSNQRTAILMPPDTSAALPSDWPFVMHGILADAFEDKEWVFRHGVDHIGYAQAYKNYPFGFVYGSNDAETFLRGARDTQLVKLVDYVKAKKPASEQAQSISNAIDEQRTYYLSLRAQTSHPQTGPSPENG